MNARDDIRIWSFGVVLAFLAGALLLAGLVPSVVSAQGMDSGWLPWVGCWEAAEGSADSPMLCVRPSSDGRGVEFLTWADGEVVSTETILADGVSREAEREGCQGFEAARFSEDNHRVYLKSEYICEDGVERGATGVLAMLNPMEWVDIKVVEEAGDRVPWVLRYRLAAASKVEAAGMTNLVAPRASEVKMARIVASARLTEDDLIDAVGKVDPEAVEALIVERGDPFRINAENLVRLADAGVPGSVIDLAVAMSYPDHFAVKRGGAEALQTGTEYAMGPRRSFSVGFGLANPYSWGYGGYGYSPYSGYGYGFSPYGYGYSSYGYGYGNYRPMTVVVQPVSSGLFSRMVKGQGYTRGGSSGGQGGSAGSPGGGGASSSGSGGGSQAVSAPGVRSSGGASSGGRVAGPRGGGRGGGGSL
jgi:hypothetical protein